MKISIDMTERDLQDLINGETFDWSYTSDTGEQVDVHLYNCDIGRE